MHAENANLGTSQEEANVPTDSASVTQLVSAGNPAQTPDWLTRVYGQAPGRYGVTGINVSGTTHNTDFQGIDSAARLATSLTAQEHMKGVYHRVTTLARSAGHGKRGAAEDSLALVGMWSDLDYGSVGHKHGKELPLPPNAEEARRIYTESGLPEATVWVHSGHGLYAWTLFDRPQIVGEDISFDDAKAMCAAWQRRLKESAARLGYDYGEGVGDLSRVLRLPGTVNRKVPDNPLPCYSEDWAEHGQTIRDGAPRYTLAELAVHAAPPEPTPETPRKAPASVQRVESPIDQWNDSQEWSQLLSEDGWDETGTDGCGCSVWQRPDADENASPRSATAHDHGCTNGSGHALFVWSEAVDGLDGNRGYSKFQYVQHYRHGGDLDAAYDALGLPRGGKRTSPDGFYPSPADTMGTARALDEKWRHEGVSTLRSMSGSWFRWKGPKWEEVSVAAVRTDIYLSLENALYEDDKGNGKRWLPNTPRVNQVEDALRSVTYLPEDTETPSYEGQDPFSGPVIACENGLLEVATRTLHPLTPRYFNLVSVPYAYDRAASEPKRWLQFLDSVWGSDTESAAALQEWFGYVVSGRTDLEKILYIQGPPRSGKGTIERALSAVIGEGNMAPTTAAKMGTEFGLASLLGKSLAVIPDARIPRDNQDIILERLLSISGGDPVSVSRKHREDYNGRLPARIMVLSNNLPDFKDASRALANRFVFLTMSKSFLGKEDTTLKEAIAQEAAGILNWALEGLARLQRNGKLTEPVSSRTARVLSESSASPLSEWLEDTFVKGDEYVISKADLYALYLAKTREDDAPHKSKENFSKDMFAAGWKPEDYRSKRGLYGDGKQQTMFRGMGLPDGCRECGRPTGAGHDPFSAAAGCRCPRPISV